MSVDKFPGIFRSKWRLLFMYTTRDCFITMLYHAIENKVANAIKATCAWSMMGRLNVIPLNRQQLPCSLIGCIL